MTDPAPQPRTRRAPGRPSRAARDRGTILLMVVGVLALLAIIGVVYATIGRGDRTSSAVAQRAKEVTAGVDQVRGYLVGLIAGGKAPVYGEPTLLAGGTVVRARGYTRPGTNQYALSVPYADLGRALGTNPTRGLDTSQGGAKYERFFADGTSAEAWRTAWGVDPRNLGDPYLASSEAEFLNFNLPAGGSNTPPAFLPALKLDWRHISNVSPSGQFVNLANLRPENGGFNAPPGFTPGSISFGLTLYDRTTGQPQDHTQNQIRWDGAIANPARPFDWDSNQVFAFRPMRDENPPSEFERIANQWADADGDGFADSRWTETTDLSALFALAADRGATAGEIPGAARLRTIIAVRALDNGSMVNVNTAGDSAGRPAPDGAFQEDALRWTTTGANAGLRMSLLDRNDAFPYGLSPAEVDLARLFDVAQHGRDIGLPAASLGYQRLLGGAVPYTDYTEAASLRIATRDAWAVVDARRRGQPPVGVIRSLPAADDQNAAARSPFFVAPTGGTAARPSAPKSRLLDYAAFSEGGIEAQQYGGGAARRAYLVPFNTADELELRQFWGLNDPETLSRLEAAATGRWAGNTELSSLRPNRNPEDDAYGRRDALPSQLRTATAGSADGDLLVAVEADVRRWLTTLSGHSTVVDSSLLGTSTAGAPYDASAALRLFRFNDPPTATQALRDRRAAEIFQQYRHALAPFTNLALYPRLWTENNDPAAASDETRGLAYGGRVEFALRAAAHMTANLIAMVQRHENTTPANVTTTKPDSSQPPAFTLKLVPTVQGTAQQFPWPELDAAAQFTGGTAPVAADLVLSGGSGRVNVFGVKAQPFLIGLAGAGVYTDTPYASTSAGLVPGDNDADTSGPGGVPGNPNAPPPPITINFSPVMANPDFLGEYLVFQVHNPFPQPVVLSEGTNAGGAASERVYFYAEYAGRTWALAEQNDADWGWKGVTLDPGETRVFVALNPGRLDMFGERICNARKLNQQNLGQPVACDSVAAARAFLGDQFGGATRFTVMPPAFKGTFTSAGPNLPVDGAAPAPFNTHAEMDLFGEATVSATATGDTSMASLTGNAPPERRVALLWRVMRTPTGETPNRYENDLLADRLRLPYNASDDLKDVIYKTVRANAPAFGGSLDEGNKKIGDTVAKPDVATDRADNTGYSLILWALAARPTDDETNKSSGYIVAGSGGKEMRRGVLPPWCMEVKADAADFTDPTLAKTACLNRILKTKKDDEGDKTDFTGTDDRAVTLAGLNQAVSGLLSRPAHLRADARAPAELKIGPTRATVNGLSAGSPPPGAVDPRLTYLAHAVEIHAIGEEKDPAGTLYVATNPAMFSRPADFLLPLCIGPSQDPSSGNGQYRSPTNQAQYAGEIGDLENQWITLSEAAAMASGYYLPDPNVDPLHANMASDALTDPAAGPLELAKTDRGHLRLDAFVPHLKLGAAGNADVQPIGSGAPLALSVVDLFRCAYGLASTPVAVTGPSGTAYVPAARIDGVSGALGSSAGFVPGSINVNSATARVLRLVPFMAPARPVQNVNYPGNPATESFWYSNLWMSAVPPAGAGTPTPAPSALFPLSAAAGRESWDFAQAVVTYRDKPRTSYTRPGSVVTATPGQRLLSFEDQPAGANAKPNGRAAGLGLATKTGAFVVNRGARLREGAGIKSVGELLAINFRDPTAPADVRPWGAGSLRAHSAFRLAEPLPTSANLNAPLATPLGYEPGVLSGRQARLDPATGRLPTATTYRELYGMDVPNAYQDKLALVNAAAGSLSVRSDVFTVYFIVHGYTPEDCQVEPGQPVLPTLAKRFVMTVDRSGSTPRVVMLKELPYTN